MAQNADNPIAVTSPRVYITSTPVLDTSQFASGDSMTTLINTLSGVASQEGGYARFTDLTITDKAANGVDLELWLFDISTVTLPTVNAAWAISDADALHVGAVIRTNTDGVWFASSNNKVCQVRGASNWIDVKCAAGSKNLYYALICRSGTPTFAASDLVLNFIFQPL